MEVMALWLDFQQRQALDGHRSLPGATSIGMSKSNLLGRLVRGEGIRRRPCPTHGGRMAPGYPLCDPGEIACCDGTGWLKDEEDPPRE